MKRTETRKIKIGDIYIGGQNKVLIQSMANIKTSRVDEVAKQINECAKLGADIMRVSILDKEDAYALKELKEKVSIPLVADIHDRYTHQLRTQTSAFVNLICDFYVVFCLDIAHRLDHNFVLSTDL